MNQRQRDEFLERSRAHRAADMLEARTYGAATDGEWRGGSIGCHLFDLGITPDDGYKHAVVAEHYGYPEWLALVQDELFEGLEEPDCLDWHVQFAEALHAIPDDYDWGRALSRVWLVALNIGLPYAPSSAAVVRQAICLHARVARGERVSEDEWSAVVPARMASAHVAWAVHSVALAAMSAARWGEATSEAKREIYRAFRDGVLDALKEGAQA